MAVWIDEKLMNKYLEKEMVRGFNDESWRDYFVKKAGWLVELEDGIIFCIERPKIETRFCYGESGYDFDDAVSAADRARTSMDHFKWENLKDIDKKIAWLEGRTEDLGYGYYPREIVIDMYPVIHWFGCNSIWRVGEDKNRRELTANEKKLLAEGYKIVRADFEKRLDRYLKRYGLSKVRSWTYWRDA